MKRKVHARPTVTLNHEGNAWTLWYGTTPLLRTLDGRGARDVARRLRSYVNRTHRSDN